MTWTNRATPRAGAQCYQHRPVDRQTHRHTGDLETHQQTDANTHKKQRALQGRARPRDHCEVLALEELTPARLPYQPLPGVSANRAPRSPRHPAPSVSRDAPARRASHPEPGRRRERRGPHPGLRTRGTPSPRVRVGPRKHPPSSSHPAASAGAGASIPRGSPGRRRRSAARTAEHAQSRPEGRGPGQPRP